MALRIHRSGVAMGPLDWTTAIHDAILNYGGRGYPCPAGCDHVGLEAF